MKLASVLKHMDAQQQGDTRLVHYTPKEGVIINLEGWETRDGWAIAHLKEIGIYTDETGAQSLTYARDSFDEDMMEEHDLDTVEDLEEQIEGVYIKVNEE